MPRVLTAAFDPDHGDDIVAMVADVQLNDVEYVLRRNGSNVAVVMSYEAYRRMVDKLGEEIR